MLSIEDAERMLEDIASELPQDFYKNLNGGINLLPDIKLHPQSEGMNNPLFILGEYRSEWMMGKYINLYYGSFTHVYAHLSPEQQKEKLREILIHEFTHHMEYMAGERGLEIKDAQGLDAYKKRKI